MASANYTYKTYTLCTTSSCLSEKQIIYKVQVLGKELTNRFKNLFEVKGAGQRWGVRGGGWEITIYPS